MDVAALDLGSNSFRVLVLRKTDRSLIRVASDRQTLGLGAHVKVTGRIPPDVFQVALDAAVRLVRRARELGATRFAGVGTHALREAENGADFARQVLLRTGVAIEIVSGETEARLSYTGARSACPGLPRRVVVADIGGGSVEIAAGEAEWCLPIASLSLGFLQLGTNGVAQVRERVHREARKVAEQACSFKPDAWVFSGGTARWFHALWKKRFGGPDRPMTRNQVRETALWLAQTDRAALLTYGVDAARAETLGAGAMLLDALTEEFMAGEIQVSSGGLCEGLILRQLLADPGWDARAAEGRLGSAERSRPSAVGRL